MASLLLVRLDIETCTLSEICFTSCNFHGMCYIPEKHYLNIFMNKTF